MANRRKKRKVPDTAIARFPIYARSLRNAQRAGTHTISSGQLARESGVQDAQLRKDLSYLGAFGVRGVGYNVEYLFFQISKHLGLLRDWPIIIVGAGRIGTALLNYRGFSSEGFNVIAIFDNDPDVIGKRAGDLTVLSTARMDEIVRAAQVEIGIIATPAAVVQQVADQMIKAGIKGILNFAPATIPVTHNVQVRNVDLTGELKILSFHLVKSRETK